MAEQVIAKSKFLKTIRELHPEVQGQDDESVTQKFLDYYPMLRRRVIDDRTGTPAYRGTGQADTLQWKGSKEQDGNYEGTYSWKQNQPAPVAPPAPDRVTAARAALEQQRPQTPVAAAPQSITVGSGPQDRVEPTQIQIPPVPEPQKYDMPDTMANLQMLGGNGPEMPEVRPPSGGDPYRIQADDYTKQAATLEQQAATPYPRPKGTKEHLIEAARAAMESFGRYGAPGGYEGQERQRRQDFAAQQNNTYARAKDLRASAQQQQTLGETVHQREAVQAETDRLRSQQEATQRETMRHNQAEEDRQRNAPVKLGPNEIMVPPTGGAPIATGAPGKDGNVGSYTNKAGKHMEIFQKQDGSLYEKEFGDVRESASAIGAAADPNTVQYIADQVRANPLNWSLAGGNKALQDQVRATLAKGGEPVNLRTAGERKDAGNISVMLEDAHTLQQIAQTQKQNIGPVAGRLAALKRATIGTGDAETNELFRLADNLADQLLRARSGAQINEREYSRLRSLVPNPRGPEDKFFSDLNGFISELERTQSARFPGAQPTAPGGGSPLDDALDKAFGKPK